MAVNFLNWISFVGRGGLAISIKKHTDKWSVMPGKWSFTSVYFNDSKDLVSTKFRVWPFLYVWLFICCLRYKLSNTVWNCWAWAFEVLSMWKLKSPQMTTQPLVSNMDSWNWGNSSTKVLVVTCCSAGVFFLYTGGRECPLTVSSEPCLLLHKEELICWLKWSFRSIPMYHGWQVDECCSLQVVMGNRKQLELYPETDCKY